MKSHPSSKLIILLSLFDMLARIEKNTKICNQMFTNRIEIEQKRKLQEHKERELRNKM